MFGQSKDSKSQFVKNAQVERQLRQEKILKETSIVKIQACVRMFISKRKVAKEFLNEFDVFFKSDPSTCHTALSVFRVMRKFLFVYKAPNDNERFLTACRAIITGLEVGKEPKYWYMSVMLLKEWTVSWLKQAKHVLQICCALLKTVKSFASSGVKAASVYLSMLVILTDCSNWKILKMAGGENIRPVMQHVCSAILADVISKGLVDAVQTFLMDGLSRQNISLNAVSLMATTTLLMRTFGKESTKSTSSCLLLIKNVLTIPAYILHLRKFCPEGEHLMLSMEMYSKVLSTLYDYKNMSLVYNSLNASSTLNLIGNILNLCEININIFESTKSALKIVLNGLLNHCQTFLGQGSGNSKWHPMFGWYQETAKTCASQDAYKYVHAQVKHLWKQPLVGTFFENLPSLEESERIVSSGPDTEGGVLRRAFMKTFKRLSSGMIDLNEPVVVDICMTCDMYRTLTSTLTQCKLEIVSSLSLQEEILVRLWRFIYSLGPGAGLKSILNYINGEMSTLPKPLSSLLILFSDCLSQLIPILDDSELYEKQKPFHCNDLVKLSAFLNVLSYKLIWNADRNGATADSSKKDDYVRSSALELLSILYTRDCRKSFTPQDHWLIRELKVSLFLTELEQKKNRAISVLQNIPHVLPHMVRVKIFHDLVMADKHKLGINKDTRASALISIRRSRLLEDGYEQLARHTGEQLKGIIRVKFINEQGLDEAGIDQDGVFKEFLEDVITKAFDPQLSLFKMTTGTEEECLYPSPTSFIHDGHLQLFGFVGKMLAKALYEGILVDVPFASFFLNSMLRRHYSELYSSIDELPSLDPEMYKNLNFIKNYTGDVSDLELVFAFDEDVLGQVVTRDLKPGGRAIPVTDSNKLMYIHLMAKYRIHTQIKEQSEAFLRGFRSIISPEWLRMFSAPELQRLISGSREHFDLSDLKANTSYYGGYHAGHQTIVWLWDILKNDFTLQEKRLFLKFVTSCSNPPLLGFQHLEPKFSVRFVDSADEEDNGDTVGSVVRGLLNVRKKNTPSSSRLPTASTCFNLLKLPCYKKKSVLKEKLRYAILSGAGFELS